MRTYKCLKCGKEVCSNLQMECCGMAMYLDYGMTLYRRKVLKKKEKNC